MTIEIVKDFMGDVCSACAHKKSPRHSFCGACYFRLPHQLRRDLYKEFRNGYAEAFAAACAWLKANPPEVWSVTNQRYLTPEEVALLP